MVARGPGAVGCAHCTILGADVACQVCTRLVCPACARDWTTCDAPSGRVVRLGRTARLRDVDPRGRFGLVSRWVGALKLLDLRELRWLDVTLPPAYKTQAGEHAARIAASGTVWQPDCASSANAANSSPYSHLERISLPSGRVFPVHADEPLRGLAMTDDDHLYYVTVTEQVLVVSPDGAMVTFDPLPRSVVQATFYDRERAIMASATWGRIVIHRVVDAELEIAGAIVCEGNVHWVSVAGPWVAAIVGTAVRVWRLGQDYSVGALAYEHVYRTTPLAALSGDGRYLAIAADKRVTVHDLDQDLATVFEDEHTDDISFVRFVGPSHVLVTGDDDNRVILRPRTPFGYARPLIDIEIPDELLALAPDLAPPVAAPPLAAAMIALGPTEPQD